jgi:PAS domain S-box-containing protein
MVTAACITMGLIHLRIGLRRKPGEAHLLFALTAFVFAAFSVIELAMMRARSSVQFLELQRWADLVGAAGAVSLAAFVWVFFATGRKWLALLGSSLVCGPLILDVLPEPKLIFLQITGIRTVETFAGASYTVAEGTRNPWVAVYYLGVLLIAVFVADASVALWRRARRRRALLVGGTTTFFILSGGVQAWLVDAGILATPYLVSFFYLAILVSMAMALSDEVLQASQLAQDLRESEQRLNLAAEAAHLGPWVWEIESDEIWTTPQGRALFGFTATERLDLNRFFAAVHPEDREPTREALRRSLGATGDYRAEYRVINPDGTTRWLSARGQVESDRQGKPIRLRGVSVDITDQKQAELELQHRQAELAHVTRVSTLGQLASSLAHELNQPLAIILTNAQAAQRLLAQNPPDLNEVRDILSDIVEEDRRAGDVIKRLRALLKHGEPTRSPLALNEAIEEVLQLLRSDLLGRGISVARELPADLPLVLADRIPIEQVILNLILNAFEAMAANAPGDRRLTVYNCRDGEAVYFGVRDTGCGLPADPETVFQAFYTTKPNGLGMGLAICRTIIAAHGGRLWAERNPERGATFCFSLPIQEGAA